MNFTQSQRYSQSQLGTPKEFSQSSHIADVTAKRSGSYYDEEAELTQKADECVQYILFCFLSERKAVVKRADLNKNILKEYSRQYRAILKMIEVRMDEVFGLELFQLDNVDLDKAEKFGVRNKYEFDFELNNAKNQEKRNSESDPVFLEQFKYSMLMISLSLIFMNDNEIEENLFWDSMKKLDVNKEEKKHKYLGDICRYFKSDLVREGYLEHEMVKGMYNECEKC